MKLCHPHWLLGYSATRNWSATSSGESQLSTMLQTGVVSHPHQKYAGLLFVQVSQIHELAQTKADHGALILHAHTWDSWVSVTVTVTLGQAQTVLLGAYKIKNSVTGKLILFLTPLLLGSQNKHPFQRLILMHSGMKNLITSLLSAWLSGGAAKNNIPKVSKSRPLQEHALWHDTILLLQLK